MRLQVPAEFSVADEFVRRQIHNRRIVVLMYQLSSHITRQSGESRSSRTATGKLTPVFRTAIGKATADITSGSRDFETREILVQN